MARALGGVGVGLLLLLAPGPAAGARFSLSLPGDSAVTVEAPSSLAFTVTNAGGGEGLSRLTLRFPPGYRITGGAPPPGWTVELPPDPAVGGITFRTTDEVKCAEAIAEGGTRAFGVEVVAPASRSVTPDALVSAEAEQSCRGVAFDPPTSLPSWARLGVEGALAAGPPILGVGGVVTVTLTLFSLSTVELAEASALLQPTGTAGVRILEGPTPATLTLVPGASGTLTWTARATSAGTLGFTAQVVTPTLTAPPTRSGTLVVGDLEVALGVTPEQAASGSDVQVQMTVTNRGPAPVTDVVPSGLTLEGTASASAPAGPRPAREPVLEPGESATFAWAVRVTGSADDTYAFSGRAQAEGGAIVSASVTSNRGVVAREEVASAPSEGEPRAVPASGFAPGTGGAASPTASSGGSTAPPAPSATVQFAALNQNGSQTGGTQFSAGMVRDLRVLTGWQNVEGTHSQRLEFYGPDGSIYQRHAAQFSGSGVVETRLPVGGTWITQHSLYGAWRVEVFLDGGATPVTTGVFILTP
jgi:hypothetical protein